MITRVNVRHSQQRPGRGAPSERLHLRIPTPALASPPHSGVGMGAMWDTAQHSLLCQKETYLLFLSWGEESTNITRGAGRL